MSEEPEIIITVAARSLSDEALAAADARIRECVRGWVATGGKVEMNREVIEGDPTPSGSRTYSPGRASYRLFR